MKNIRKEYRLPVETVRTISRIKTEQSLGTDSEALRFLVDQYRRVTETDRRWKEKENDLVQRIKDEIEDLFMRRIERIRMASVYAERNSRIALDAINTMLYETNADVLMEASGVTRHNVVIKAEEKYQKRLEHNKQVCDHNSRGSFLYNINC